MTSSPCLPLTDNQVQEAFLAAPPALSEQILVKNLQHPIWLTDLIKVSPFPHGVGTEMQQLILRGELPKLERGFDKWKRLGNNQGCAPCDGPDCSYVWSDFGGHGISRKVMSLMTRDFRSPLYCIKQIQTTHAFMQIFDQTVNNLHRQTAFFKEYNVSFNGLTEIAKAYVIDSGGAKGNRANIYNYPTVGSTRLSAVNIEIFEFFYEFMRRIPDATPLMMQGASPLFGALMSEQLLSRLYRDDPSIRQDVRFSSQADSLVRDYNFVDKIRNMFIPTPILYPRRFNIVGGELVEVYPFINGVPDEVGSHTDFSPAYNSATHEEIILYGLNPFELMVLPTLTTLGNNTDFGPEYEYFNAWQWFNPRTEQDPFGREGRFLTNATIGISQQYSEGVYKFVVERPRVSLMATFYPEPVCPPDPVTCGNEIDAPGCPCPLIESASANPVTPGNYFIVLTVALADTVNVSDTIQLGVQTGGSVDAEVVTISDDRLVVEVTISEDLPSCDIFTDLFCDDTGGCSASVLLAHVNCADATRLDLTLSNPLKGDVGDTLTIFYGDGSSASVTVISKDSVNNLWVVDVGGTAFCDDVGGVLSLCVPPATDDSCPACGTAPTTEACST